ncbi:site-specific integrase [Mongoliimonas terrestris]|uniref:site-specific integrase n=1 Tax=Mongoliimonas terrestris TaxID=1709001 RepID=UPI000B212587|nr:site-specific integrase [Mongoliimonas terrestris]
MSASSSKRPSAVEVVATMADLMIVVQADAILPESRRRNLTSSIRCFCRVLGFEPESATASFDFFRDRLGKFSPAHAKMRPHRWRTIRSEVGFALRRFVLKVSSTKEMIAQDKEWAAVRSCLATRKMPWALSRLIRYCLEQGIGPRAVDDTVLAGYIDAYRQTTFKTDPDRHYYDVCKVWRQLATDSQLGLKSVAIPSRVEVYTPAWKDIVPSFVAEVDAWLSAMSEEGDLLAENGPNRPLRPASVKSYRYSVLQIVAGLCHSGRPLASIKSLSDLVKGDAPKLALQFHLDRNNGEPSTMLSMIAHVLLLIAKHAVRADTATVYKIARFRQNLTPRNAGMRPLPKKALQQFSDPKNSQTILLLPIKIEKRLRRSTSKTTRNALLMQIAVALELLLVRPIRSTNLLSLRLGVHIKKFGTRTIVAVDGTDVKNGMQIEHELPTESARLLDNYVCEWLPLLGHNPKGFLFPGATPDRPKCGAHFGRYFKKRIHAETGLNIYPHFLRHFAATLYLTERPGEIEVMRRVLGHRSAQTTQNSYSGVQDKHAVGRFDDLVLKLRTAVVEESGSD